MVISKLVITNLGVTGTLCSFRVVLERKVGKEICKSLRLECIERILANKFALPDADNKTLGH